MSVVAHLHRGNVLRELHRWDEALNSYNRAIAIRPDKIDGYFNRGVLFEQLKQFPQAIASFDLAIAIRPDFAPAQYNRALVLLATGDLVRGFKDYEWRWKNRGTSLDPARYNGTAPLWFGRESLEKKIILVFSEQGLGDTLQFCRYIKFLAARGAQVILEVQPPLLGLLADIEGAATVIPRGGAVPHCDYKCALLSLPLAFKTSLESIPSERKYLRVDPERIARWHAQLGAAGSSQDRIGMEWQCPISERQSAQHASRDAYRTPAAGNSSISVCKGILERTIARLWTRIPSSWTIRRILWMRPLYVSAWIWL